jgi:alkyl sulfatase BDS1-like metallo-beta-lactamase superfamily hydrolase
MSVEFNQVLSDQDMHDIKQAIDLIHTKLPFLVTLSVDERKRLYKMGDKRIAFVQNSLNAAQSNPNILPASFDLHDFNQRYQMALRLNEVLMRLQQLHEQVDDTELALGSEAMTQSLTVYDYVKTAAKKTPGLKGIAEQLGTLFKAIRNKAPKPAIPAVVAPD